MSMKKCVFDESCKNFNERAMFYSYEEYEILNEFCELKKFVESVVSFFYGYFSLETLLSMKNTIVKFIIDNQKIFGFYTIYSNSTYFDLVSKFLSQLE